MHQRPVDPESISTSAPSQPHNERTLPTYQRANRRWKSDRGLRTVRSVIRRLTQLIGAVDDTLALPPPDEFADGQSGASGGSSSGDQRPIPHVAELMVLRAMQMDLNQRTRALAGAMNPRQADESQLDAARRLGVAQEQLRALTSRVTQQARSRRPQ